MGKVAVDKRAVLIIAPGQRIFGEIYIFKFLIFDSKMF